VHFDSLELDELELTANSISSISKSAGLELIVNLRISALEVKSNDNGVSVK
jgi:hypothetical protein